MTIDDTPPPSGRKQGPDHLCVLVHGLWGNPSHMGFVASSLKERYSEAQLHVLAAETNRGNFTYDGIELGGERLTHEIEETIERLEEEGTYIKKISIVGYSLGGLVARYALGLLHARGWLDKLEPVNFTTFASPHVGAQKPLKGIESYLWNNLGPRLISTSGRQLFMVDTFRDTGRPLLSILADQDSIFVQALHRFKNRSVYANVVNDRSTAFYSTAISTVDPFQDLNCARIAYVKGYEPVIVDSSVGVVGASSAAPVKDTRSWLEWIQQQTRNFYTQLPFWLFLIVFIAVIFPLFLLNSIRETFRSRQRIRLHEQGESGVPHRRYRVPFLVQRAVEEVFEDVVSRREPEFLTTPIREEENQSESDDDDGDNTTAQKQGLLSSSQMKSGAVVEVKQPGKSVSAPDPSPSPGPGDRETVSLSSSEDGDTIGAESQQYPTLALTAAQFSIVESLNSVGFRKYPVYIHNHRHSHAAIIIRVAKKGFDEGKTVVQHWLDREFEI